MLSKSRRSIINKPKHYATKVEGRSGTFIGGYIPTQLVQKVIDEARVNDRTVTQQLGIIISEYFIRKDLEGYAKKTTR